MKKFFLLGAVLSLLPLSVFALDLGVGAGSTANNAAQRAGYSPNTTETTFSETLGTVVKAALSLVGVIFMGLIFYAGFLWMTARGDESKIEKAQDMIRSSVIGLIITLGAYSITAFVLPRVLSRTTGQSGGSGTVGSAEVGICAWTGTPQIGHTGAGQRSGSSSGIARDACHNFCETSAASNEQDLVTCTFNGQPS